MIVASHGGGRCVECGSPIRKGHLLAMRTLPGGKRRVCCTDCADRARVDVKHVRKMARDLARPKPSRPMKSRPTIQDERRRVRRELKEGGCE